MNISGPIGGDPPFPPTSSVTPSFASSEKKKNLERSNSLSQFVPGAAEKPCSSPKRLMKQASLNHITPTLQKINEASHTMLPRKSNFGLEGVGHSRHFKSENPISKRSLDDITRQAEQLLIDKQSITDPSSVGMSPSTTPTTADTVSNLERATRAVDLLACLADELELEESEKLNSVKALIQDLKSAIIEERLARTEMITALCEKLSPGELRNLGLSETSERVKEYDRCECIDDKYQAQGDIIRSFDEKFYDKNSFTGLAQICAAKTMMKNPNFKYHRLTGGTGCALTLNVVKQTPKGIKLIPIFVCKPVNSQPGGKSFYPFPDLISEKAVVNRIQEEVELNRNTINDQANRILQGVFSAKAKLLHEFARERLGQHKDTLENMEAEALRKLLCDYLDCEESIVTDSRALRILELLKALFNLNVFGGEFVIDLTKDDHVMDDNIRNNTREAMKKEIEHMREVIKEEGEEMVRQFRGVEGVEINHVVCSDRTLSEKYPSIFETSLFSTMIPLLPVLLTTPDGPQYNLDTTMVMEYCPNQGSLESIHKNNINEIPQDQFHQDQIEKRYIIGLIFGFADQNVGNELIVDKQVIPTTKGSKEMVRLASIDMGQCNPIETGTSNNPFYKNFECMKDKGFYENISRRIADVDFDQLINDIALLYKENGMPLAEKQIQLMIFRCEMLKTFVAQGLGSVTPPQKNLLSVFKKYADVVEVPKDVNFEKLFALEQTVTPEKTSLIRSVMAVLRKSHQSEEPPPETFGTPYVIQGKTYRFLPPRT